MSLLWWSANPEPSPDLGRAVMQTLAPEAGVDDVLVEVRGYGVEVLRISSAAVDDERAVENALDAGWLVEEYTTSGFVIDTGEVLVDRSREMLVVDPHRSSRPAVAQLISGLVGAVAFVAWVRSRFRREGPIQARVSAALAWGMVIPMAVVPLAVGLELAAHVGRPDAAFAIPSAIGLTWWLLVPVGAVVGVVAWFAMAVSPKDTVDGGG